MSSCPLRGPLLYSFLNLLGFLIEGNHASGTIPVDAIRLKFYVDCLFDPTRTPVSISINKLDLGPNWIVAGLAGVFRNGAERSGYERVVYPPRVL